VERMADLIWSIEGAGVGAVTVMPQNAVKGKDA
jgi:hypothetical protein